jgi:hypothetical protein
MSKNFETLAMTSAGGLSAGTVAYASAVKGLGLGAWFLWKMGLPVILMTQGPVIIMAAGAGAAVVGGSYALLKGGYAVKKAICDRAERLNRVANEYHFEDGPQ